MRYALIDNQGEFYGKFPTLKDALFYGRRDLKNFRIWDMIEDRILLTYE